MVGTMVPGAQVANLRYGDPPSEELPPEIEELLQRIMTSSSLPTNFLKLRLLWHMQWEFYTPSTLEELAGWVHGDLTETRVALDELCATGLVQRVQEDWEEARYTLPDDDDLCALMVKFFDAYHQSHEMCERVIQRFTLSLWRGGAGAVRGAEPSLDEGGDPSS